MLNTDGSDEHRRAPPIEMALLDALGGEHVFTGLDEAIDYFRSEAGLWQAETAGMSTEDSDVVLGPLLAAESTLLDIKSQPAEKHPNLKYELIDQVERWIPHEVAKKTFRRLREGLGLQYAVDFYAALQESPFASQRKSKTESAGKTRLAKQAADLLILERFRAESQFDPTLKEWAAQAEESRGEMESLRGDLARAHKDAIKVTEGAKEILSREQQRIDTELQSSQSHFNEELEVLAQKAELRVKSLEQLFEDNLRFQAPSRYWKERAASLRWQGLAWSAGLIAGVCGASAVLMWYLLRISDGTWSQSFGIHSLPSVAAFLGVLGAIGFGLKFLGRMTYSAFHLQRDAEERLQLTNFYLALGEEANKDPATRQLVLQSLFSRSDSGLLGGEHGPSLPKITDLGRSGGSTGS